MISKLPLNMQKATRHFMETGEFRNPKTKLDVETSDRVLLSYDRNVTNGYRQDNTEVDLNPAKGVVEYVATRHPPTRTLGTVPSVVPAPQVGHAPPTPAMARHSILLPIRTPAHPPLPWVAPGIT